MSYQVLLTFPGQAQIDLSDYGGQDLLNSKFSYDFPLCGDDFQGVRKTLQIQVLYNSTLALNLLAADPKQFILAQVKSSGSVIFTGVVEPLSSLDPKNQISYLTLNLVDYSALLDVSLLSPVMITQPAFLYSAASPSLSIITKLLTAAGTQNGFTFDLSALPSIATGSAGNSFSDTNVWIDYFTAKVGDNVWQVLTQLCAELGWIPSFNALGQITLTNYMSLGAATYTFSDSADNINDGSFKLGKIQGQNEDTIELSYRSAIALTQAGGNGLQPLSGFVLNNGDFTDYSIPLGPARKGAPWFFPFPTTKTVFFNLRQLTSQVAWDILYLDNLVVKWIGYAVTQVAFNLDTGEVSGRLFTFISFSNLRFINPDNHFTTFTPAIDANGKKCVPINSIIAFDYTPSDPLYSHLEQMALFVDAYGLSQASAPIYSPKNRTSRNITKKYQAAWIIGEKPAQRLADSLFQNVISNKFIYSLTSEVDRPLGEVISLSLASHGLSLTGIIIGKAWTFGNFYPLFTYKIKQITSVSSPSITSVTPVNSTRDSLAELVKNAITPTGQVAQPIHSQNISPGFTPVSTGVVLTNEQFGFWDDADGAWRAKIDSLGNVYFGDNTGYFQYVPGFGLTLKGELVVTGNSTISGTLGSANYQSGISGYQLRSDGFAEFNNVSVRGTVFATSGEFSGTIHAGAGDIAGWDITQGALSKNNVLLHSSGFLRLGIGSSVAVLSSADPAYRFWAGAEAAASAPFRVALDGSLVSTSGQIAGWTISASTLSRNNTVLDSAGVLSLGSGNDLVMLSAADPNYRIWAGNANPATAPFTVTKDGSLKASRGAIASWLIGISGNKLQSAADGLARLELDPVKMRISVVDSTDTEKIAMGYLAGLPKRDGSGTWGPGDYGFWAKQGDKLRIDGDAEYINGDWLISNDASYLIFSGSTPIVRLGTFNAAKGLFLNETNFTSGIGYRAKLTPGDFFVGDQANFIKYEKGSLDLQLTNFSVTSLGTQVNGLLTVNGPVVIDAGSTGELAIGGGVGADDGRNTVTWGLRGFGAPGSWNTNSTGDKMVLWSNGIDTDTRIGISISDALWIKAMGSAAPNLFALWGSAANSGAASRVFSVAKNGLISATADLQFPDNTSVGLRNITGNAILRLQDFYGHTQLRQGASGKALYLDGETIYLRTPDSYTMTITGAGVGITAPTASGYQLNLVRSEDTSQGLRFRDGAGEAIYDSYTAHPTVYGDHIFRSTLAGATITPLRTYQGVVLLGADAEIESGHKLQVSGSGYFDGNVGALYSHTGKLPSSGFWGLGQYAGVLGSSDLFLGRTGSLYSGWTTDSANLVVSGNLRVGGILSDAGYLLDVAGSARLTSSLSFPSSTSVGVQNVSGLSYYRPQDAAGNAILRAGESGQHLYIDGSTIHIRAPNSDVMTLTSSLITSSVALKASGYTAGNAEFNAFQDFRKASVSSGSAGFLDWFNIPADTNWIIIGTSASGGTRAMYLLWSTGIILHLEALTNGTDGIFTTASTMLKVYRSPSETLNYYAVRLYTTILV